MFKGKKIVYVTDYRDMNKRIAFCVKNRIYAPTKEYAERSEGTKWYYTLEIKFTRLILCYRPEGGTYGEYIFFLDGSTKDQQISGMLAFNLLQRLSNKGVEDLTGNWNYYDKKTDEWFLGHIAGLVWFNPKYINGRYENCIEYDTNNAYAYAMLGDIPDTKVLPRSGIVGPNEIGFSECQKGLCDEIYLYAIFEEGKHAEYIYPKIPSPFAKFVNYYYNKRRNSKNKKEKEKIKQILNYAIGYIARKNPFIHSTILSRARYRIESFVDLETTLYSNTDSIISTIPRPDLEALCGDELGQFHINHKGSFAYNGSGYQWNYDIPSIRGRSKKWFENAYPNGYDILKDAIPFVEANKYYFDREEYKIKLCQNI